VQVDAAQSAGEHLPFSYTDEQVSVPIEALCPLFAIHGASIRRLDGLDEQVSGMFVLGSIAFLPASVLVGERCDRHANDFPWCVRRESSWDSRPLCQAVAAHSRGLAAPSGWLWFRYLTPAQEATQCE
jgi:hypothetical protein